MGDGGKGVLAVKHQQDAAGLQCVSLHLLPGMRHIVLCEKQSGTAGAEHHRPVADRGAMILYGKAF